jgi:hypothetical protein
MGTTRHSENHHNTEPENSSEKSIPPNSPNSMWRNLIMDLHVSDTHLQIAFKKDKIHSRQERSCYEQKEERI